MHVADKVLEVLADLPLKQNLLIDAIVDFPLISFGFFVLTAESDIFLFVPLFWSFGFPMLSVC